MLYVIWEILKSRRKYRRVKMNSSLEGKGYAHQLFVEMLQKKLCQAFWDANGWSSDGNLSGANSVSAFSCWIRPDLGEIKFDGGLPSARAGARYVFEK